MKTKVLVYIKDGLVSSIHSNGEVEVCILEDDQNEPSSFTQESVQNHEAEPFDQLVRDSWKSSIESCLKHDNLVEVFEIQDIRAFSGTVDGGVKTETDGSFYVTVLDQEDNAFAVDIFNISLKL